LTRAGRKNGGIYFRKAGQINFKHPAKQSCFPGEFDLTQVSKIIQKNGQGFQKLGKLRVEVQYFKNITKKENKSVALGAFITFSDSSTSATICIEQEIQSHGLDSCNG
jgi:hypothetical protein